MTVSHPVVRDFIVPITTYPHLRETETLSQAVSTILSHSCGDNGRLRYADMLVVDEKQQLVGRLNLQAILKALDKRFTSAKGYEGKDGEYPNLAILWEDSFFNTCASKNEVPIKDFMLATGTVVKGEDSVLKALSIMLHNNEETLPVIGDGAIIGVIRLEEIFAAICNVCKL